jgi:hypothetical protein
MVDNMSLGDKSCVLGLIAVWKGVSRHRRKYVRVVVNLPVDQKSLVDKGLYSVASPTTPLFNAFQVRVDQCRPR